jgi:hypothetical protein
MGLLLTRGRCFMTNLTSNRSGGVNVEGDTSVGADIVGRDKITTYINLTVSLEQLMRTATQIASEQQKTTSIEDVSTAMDWLEVMESSVQTITECAIYGANMIRDLGLEERKWNTKHESLLARIEAGEREKESIYQFSETYSRLVRRYTSQITALIPEYHQAWNSFSISQRQMMAEIGAKISQTTYDQLRPIYGDLLEVFDRFSKWQDQSIRLLTRALESNIRDYDLSDSQTLEVRKCVTALNDVQTEVGLGRTYVADVLRRFDQIPAADSPE